MAFRNVPFRSEVLAWDADSLADYFKKLFSIGPALCDSKGTLFCRGWPQSRGPRQLLHFRESQGLNYKDCEKAVRKHHIDGPRFLNLAENDIQKFPKLRVPILSKLSQEINKNEERRSIFTRKPQVQRFPEETESHEEDNGGWSSFVSTGQAVLPPCSGFQSNSVIRNAPNARRSKAQIEPPRGQIMCSVKGRG
uniref:Lymphocyte cytosolic protein 2 n=1 Tax=Sus scrofa TaxID=9823 RepID=A0A8D0T270_PIG